MTSPQARALRRFVLLTVSKPRVKPALLGPNPFWVSFGGTREASVPGPDLALGGLQKGFVPADGLLPDPNGRGDQLTALTCAMHRRAIIATVGSRW